MTKRLKITHLDFQGLPVSIENPKGSVRHWYDSHNKTHGETKMKHDYGYFRRTEGEDGEGIDVYIGPHRDQDKVYIIRQNKAPNFDKYDEDKVMVGFRNAKEAKEAYLQHYNSPKFFDSMTSMTVEEFKDTYVKKAFDPQSMVPTMDPYDMDNPQAVQAQLGSVASTSDKELSKLAQAVWGEGYEYHPISPNQMRAELRGFLQDQIEWLQLNPMTQMDQGGSMPTPNEMPHSSPSSPMYGPGGEDSADLLNEANLDGSVSADERQIS